MWTHKGSWSSAHARSCWISEIFLEAAQCPARPGRGDRMMPPFAHGQKGSWPLPLGAGVHSSDNHSLTSIDVSFTRTCDWDCLIKIIGLFCCQYMGLNYAHKPHSFEPRQTLWDNLHHLVARETKHLALTPVTQPLQDGTESLICKIQFSLSLLHSELWESLLLLPLTHNTM